MTEQFAIGDRVQVRYTWLGREGRVVEIRPPRHPAGTPLIRVRLANGVVANFWPHELTRMGG